MNISDIKVGGQYRVTKLSSYPKGYPSVSVGDVMAVGLIDQENGDLTIGLEYPYGLLYVNPIDLEIA